MASSDWFNALYGNKPSGNAVKEPKGYVCLKCGKAVLIDREDGRIKQYQDVNIVQCACPPKTKA